MEPFDPRQAESPATNCLALLDGDVQGARHGVWPMDASAAMAGRVGRKNLLGLPSSASHEPSISAKRAM